MITEESNTPIGQMCIDVFGVGWGAFKIAHMSTADNIGVEMLYLSLKQQNAEGF